MRSPSPQEMDVPQRARPESGYARLNTDTTVSQLAHQDKVPWYNKPNLRLLYLLMIPACIGVQITSGFDVAMTNGLQAVSSWLEYFNYPHSASLGIMTSMYSLGSIVAAPFTSLIVDKLGRRFPILLGGVISIIGSILQGFALNFTMFTVARFILGFANIISIVAASSLIGELSHPKERAVMGGLFNSLGGLGSVSAAGVVLWTFSMTGNWGWRIPSLLQIVPSLLQVSFIWFLPESPRWLLSRRRGHEAFTVLVKYHAEGDQDSEFVQAEFSQMEHTLEAELHITRAGSNKPFLTLGMRRRITIAAFLGLFVHWCGYGLSSKYLSLVLDGIGIHDNRTKNIINLAKNSWHLVNATAAVLVASKHPRRTVFMAGSSSFFAIFIAWTLANASYSLTGSKIFSYTAVALIFLFSPTFNLGFIALTYAYLVELFPFYARARGIVIYQWSSRVAAFISEFVNPIGISAIGWRWYIVYCVWNAFQVIFIYVMFPETSGCTLEELTFLYEEDREAYRPDELERLIEHEVE